MSRGTACPDSEIAATVGNSSAHSLTCPGSLWANMQFASDRVARRAVDDGLGLQQRERQWGSSIFRTRVQTCCERCYHELLNARSDNLPDILVVHRHLMGLTSRTVMKLEICGCWQQCCRRLPVSTWTVLRLLHMDANALSAAHVATDQHA